ncbi:MAG: BrnT family toxin [Endomicrobiales bacterium]|jgi:uncharacterized DUF497 family protein
MKNDILNYVEGFDWDMYNADKILQKHNVTVSECEEVLINDIVVAPDEKHSLYEQRYFILGVTEAERMLFVVFTIRRNKIRVISARAMNKKEKEVYHEKTKTNPKI